MSKKKQIDLEPIGLVIDQINIPVSIIDIHGNIVKGNDRFENMLAMVNKDGSLTEVIDEAFSRVRDANDNNTQFEYDFPGLRLLVNVTLMPSNEDSMSTGAIFLFRDITKMRDIEEELKIANENLQELDAIFHFSYDGIFVCDGNAIGLKINEAYARVTGINDPWQMIGMSMQDAVDKGYVSESVTLKVLEKKEPVTTMPKLKSGKKVLMTGNPVFNQDGEIIRIITNVRDISELIALHSKLDEAKKLSERYYSEILHLRSQQMQFDGVVIESEVMKGIFATALKVAATNATILITGDSGSGKEVLARAIHNQSEFKSGPFLKINCGAIPETLLESELFGYEPGAFTNACKKGKLGLFELARKGTVFLDEIGEIPMNLQAKLLGVLQDHHFTRVGGVEQKDLDARIITATNRDLEAMIEDKQFRKDLYYRINIVTLKIPPLNERKDDIFPMANCFLQKFNEKYKTNKEFSPQVIDYFLRYSWPGNVRELENLIERLVLLTSEPKINIDLLPEAMKKIAPLHSADIIIRGGKSLATILEDVERQILVEFVDRGYSTYRIAKELKISQPTVFRKIRRLKGKGK